MCDTDDGGEDSEPVIKFLCDPKIEGAAEPPQPAQKVMPDYFSELDFMQPDEQLSEARPVRNCMSFLDGLSLGWVLTLPADLGWEYTEDGRFHWECKLSWDNYIEFHKPEQLGNFPHDGPIIKFNNPWKIETPSGYSTLFTQPFNRPEDRFQVFTGVVETDEYGQQVNMPAAWQTEPGTEGVIPRGTPFAQVIPYSRDGYIREAEHRTMTEEEAREVQNYDQRVNAETGYYRKHVWAPDKSTTLREADEPGGDS